MCFTSLQIHHYVTYHMPVNSFKVFTNWKLTFCRFEGYYIHKSLDSNSILFWLILMNITSIVCKVDKTMPVFHVFTKLGSHAFWRKLHDLHRKRLRLELRKNTSKRVLISSNMSYLACTLFHNPGISLFLGVGGAWWG